MTRDHAECKSRKAGNMLLHHFSSWSADSKAYLRPSHAKAKIYRWLLSRNFQLALQISLACAFASLFTVIRRLAFPEACIAAEYVLIAYILLCPTHRLGCHLNAAANVLFAAAYCPAFAGLLASLAHAPGRAYTACLCVFSILGLIPVTAVRVAKGGQGPGTIFNFIYGTAIIPRIQDKNVGSVWKPGVAYTIASVCITVAAMLLASCLVLPSLSGGDARKQLSLAIRGMGHQISAYGSVLIGPRIAKGGLEESESDRLRESTKDLRRLLRLPEDSDSVDHLVKNLRKRTDPTRHRKLRNEASFNPAPTLKALRLRLNQAGVSLSEAKYEPEWIQAGPHDPELWADILTNAKLCSTRISTLTLMTQNGSILDRGLLEMCGASPFPILQQVFSEMALSLFNLSEAIKHAGNPQIARSSAKLHWDDTKRVLFDMVSTFRAAYWQMHRAKGIPHAPNEPQALELRALFLLVTLTNGIIDALAVLEDSVYSALGVSTINLTRKVELEALGDISAQKAANGLQDTQTTDSSMHGEQKSASGNFKVRISRDEYDSVHMRGCSLDFMVRFAKAASGIDAYLILKGVYREAVSMLWGHDRDLRGVLQDRKVQYFFKVWLCLSTILVCSIIVCSLHPLANSWKLYYAYVTASAILIPHVEAALWKMMQRVAGTLAGGTLAYLIMLRSDVNSRGAAVVALACFGCFVIIQFLHSAFRYSVYLTCLTLLTLTICSVRELDRPGRDFEAWKTRVTNIIVGAVFAMAISWLLLPWYASDEHLSLIADSYAGAGRLIVDSYDTLFSHFQIVAQGGTAKTLNSRLEKEIVAPLAAAVSGLRRDTVFWQKGLLSSPPIVEELSLELRRLVHCCAALELSVTQAPTHFGKLGSQVFHQFLDVLHTERKETIQSLVRLVRACDPILRHGCRPPFVEKVKGAIAEAENRRAELNSHFLELRHRSMSFEVRSANEQQEPAYGGMTAAESIKLSSYIVAACKTYDQIMVIAHIIIDSRMTHRDNWWTSLFSLSGTETTD